MIFLVLFVYAAAAYGLTRESYLPSFEIALGGTFGLWLAGHLLQGRPPQIGFLSWLVCGAVLLFGWSTTIVAVLNDALAADQLPAWCDYLIPDWMAASWCSYDSSLSVIAMSRTSALLGGMLIAIDLWRQPNWSRILQFTMILSAFGMVAFFILQRIVGGPFLLESEDHVAVLSFATYRYHGNGAAYLNLFWPMAVSIAVYSAIRRSPAWPVWLIPAVAIFFACYLNPSKAGGVFATVGIVVLLAFIIPPCRVELRRAKRRIRRGVALGAGIPLLIILLSLPFAIPWKRWNHLLTAKSDGGGRQDAYAEFVKMIPQAGAVGFGPGTFQRYYGHYVQDSPKLRHEGYWVAHEDYIQTVVEWGYIGTALWALLMIPPGAALLTRAVRKPPVRTGEFEGYRITILDHLKAFVDALPDPREPYVAAGALLSVLLTAVHSSFDFPMQIASLQLYFLVLLALGWSYLLPASSRPRTTEELSEY
ncbi:MAG TPA: O-antigen ligase family protein [Chthoniobacterales bacterium]